jgi:3-oxoacyl-[acyl-carrier-protein] synthase-3
MHGYIASIEYFLPEQVISTADLSAMFPKWSVEKIDAKTGIQERHIAAKDECASDLAVTAARKLFDSCDCNPQEIDFLLFCSQSPDYALPATACLLQDRLGIPVNCGALDFNLGCSGFVYGLGLAEGLIASGQANSILLITAETISKYLDDNDKGSRTIFGDGAAVSLIRGSTTGAPAMGPFLYGTDGRGGKHLIVTNSGSRRLASLGNTDSGQEERTEKPSHLHMDGAKIFDFALTTVPACVMGLLSKAGLQLEDIDLFVFHQANAFLLEEIRAILGIPESKFQITLSHCANTNSATIPIALKHAELQGRLKKGDAVMLVGFGVGYSWAGTIIRWMALDS